jgi:hemolysin III
MRSADKSKLRLKSKDGSQHVTDEQFNTASHLLAAVFALLGSVYLIVISALEGKPWHLAGFIVYGLGLTGLFLSSSLHHGINSSPRMNRVLKNLDYCFIFLLIAGCFTPMVLVLFRTPLGWSIFGMCWGVAVIGMILRLAFVNLPKWVTMMLYLGLGWMAVFLGPDMILTLPFPAIVLMTLGGLFYTFGAIIFIFERPNPIPGRFGFHEIWHIFVIFGAAAHYGFMVSYVLPAP